MGTTIFFFFFFSKFKKFLKMAKKWGKKVEKSWETVQIKAFTHWVNTVLEQREMRIEDLSQDLSSGVELINFLELLSGKSLNKKYDKKPQMRIQKIQNVHLALKFLESEMDVKLVGIGAEDFVDSQTKLILGFLWSLFRKFKIATIKEEDKSSEEGLLLWVTKQTEGYPKVEITNFKNSFRSGYAFLALIDKYKEGLVDYQKHIDNEDPRTQLEEAFRVAEESLAVPSLLNADDVMNGEVDERGLVLYVSLYFHAYMALSERDRLESSKREMSSKLESVEERLKREQEEKERLEQERLELQKQQEELAALLSTKAQNYDELAAQNEALRKALDELNAKFDQQTSEIRQLKAELTAIHGEKASLRDKDDAIDKKVKQLTKLLEQEAGDDFDEQGDDDDGDAATAKAGAADELTKRLAQTQTALEKEKALKEFEEKLIADLRARAAAEKAGLDLLSKHLDLHVTDLHRWQKYLKYDEEAFVQFEDNRDGLLASLGPNSTFAEQVDLLAEKLEAENTTLTKLLKQKKADDGKGDAGKTGKKADKSAKSSSSSSTTTKDSKKKSKK